MTTTLKAAAAAVRAYWRTKKPEPELSEQGRALLALIDSLPSDGVVVSRAVLAKASLALREWLSCGVAAADMPATHGPTTDALDKETMETIAALEGVLR